MAAFLASAKYEGNNLFCDGEDGVVFLLSSSYDIGSMCYTVQRMLQALAVLYFLAFIVTVNLIGSTVRYGSQTEDLGEDGEDARGPQAMAREAK